jgi:septal ring factor EnvC (AmiA/AmiB activator)
MENEELKKTLYEVDSILKKAREEQERSDMRCDTMMRDLERTKQELQSEIYKNEELKKELRANEDYRRRAEDELRTIGDEVEKFKVNNEAEFLREISSLKGQLNDQKY